MKDTLVVQPLYTANSLPPALPTRCLDCPYLGSLPGSAGLCEKMNPPLALLRREVMTKRPVFCPLDPDYRPAADIKKPR